MADSPLNGAEHRVQQSFIKSAFFSALVTLAPVMAFQAWLAEKRPPLDLSPRVTSVRYQPADLGQLENGARIAGAWKVEVDDPRLGGLSGQQGRGALAVGLLPAGQQQAQRSAQGITQQMNLGGQSATGSPQSLLARPLFPVAAC